MNVDLDNICLSEYWNDDDEYSSAHDSGAAGDGADGWGKNVDIVLGRKRMREEVPFCVGRKKARQRRHYLKIMSHFFFCTFLS